LYNFLVLLALCKKDRHNVLHKQAEWLEFLRTISIKAGQWVFTAQTIEHAILRAGMAVPKLKQPEVYCPRFGPEDPRRRFQHLHNEPLITFGLYIPTM
jgi:hypothetical protein